MEKGIPNSCGTTAAGHYNVQLLGKAQPKVQQWVLEGEEDPGVLLSIMSGFLAAKATARSPRVSPQKHAAVFAGSVPRSLAHGDHKEQRAITNHSLSPVLFPGPPLLIAKQKAENTTKMLRMSPGVTPCYVTQPTSRPHRASA